MDKNILALNVLIDYSIGTLWNITEELWKKRIHEDEHYDSNRMWHPGLSLCSARIRDSYEMVPILHGSSHGSKRSSVVIKGVTKFAGEEKRTYFGRIFAPMEISDFLFNSGYISKNKHKPKINTDELRQLKTWMKKKGL